jgi:RND family efflux transporter MFP subunit
MAKLILSLFVLLAILVPAGCGEKIEPGETKQPPKTLHRLAVATARLTDERLVYEAVATVQAGLTANLSAKYAGAVKVIKVREGARVRKGDTLAALDQAQAVAGLQQAEAALSEAKRSLAAAVSASDAARAAKDLALMTFRRFENLKKTESVGIQEFDEVEARHRQAEAALMQAEELVQASTARVKQAEAAFTSARVTLEDMVITAPYDGIISARLVDEGVLASPGMPLLTIETSNAYRVDAMLAETYIGHVSLGQKVLVRIPSLNDELLEGKITTIVPSADERSRSFLLKVSLPPHGQVKSGLFARVQIPLGTTSHLRVPKQAVVSRGQLTGLFVVDSEKIAHFRLIRTGRTSGDLVEVLAGLKQGDRYVENPPLHLKEGDGVEGTL